MKLDNVGMEKSKLLREIKEKLSYVPLDYEEEMAHGDTVDLELQAYVLPDGENILMLDQETRCKSGELLLRPEVAGIPQSDLCTNILASLSMCDDYLRNVTKTTKFSIPDLLNLFLSPFSSIILFSYEFLDNF